MSRTATRANAEGIRRPADQVWVAHGLMPELYNGAPVRPLNKRERTRFANALYQIDRGRRELESILAPIVDDSIDRSRMSLYQAHQIDTIRHAATALRETVPLP